MPELHFSPRPNRAADIRWREWGDEPFREAEREGKPVLLAISAVWCHWCHVMDETTYSDDGVIGLINDRFIPVRVDNDRRPDVNARYNQGGWPTTAVLTPAGELLKGGTYIPPGSLLQLLRQIDELYADPAQRRQIDERIRELRERRPSRATAASGPLRTDIPDRIFSSIDAEFDERFAGFGTDQKFPRTDVLQFLLDVHARRRDSRSREIVQRTLHAMSGGGMYDRVQGGFYRYSTTRDFSVPHYEKILEDLGGLLLATARSASMFDDEDLARVAVDVRSYMDAWLWVPELGAYGGSQDADEEYYALDAQGRLERTPPYVDKTIYTSWNARAAIALIAGGPLLGPRPGVEPDEWTSRGLTILESLWRRASDGGLMPRWFDGGTVGMSGLLADQAWCVLAATEAYSATGDAVWRERALALAESSERLFDADAVAYADRPRDADRQGRLADQAFPFDENATMARGLLRIGKWNGRFVSRAASMLGAAAATYRDYGTFAAAFGSAVLDALDPAVDVTIGGLANAPSALELRAAARRISEPPIRIDFDGSQPEGATVCRGETCYANARTSAELTDAICRVRSP